MCDTLSLKRNCYAVIKRNSQGSINTFVLATDISVAETIREHFESIEVGKMISGGSITQHRIEICALCVIDNVQTYYAALDQQQAEQVTKYKELGDHFFER